MPTTCREIGDDRQSLFYCATCNGSGEGQHDGARCSNCRGSGVEPSALQCEELDAFWALFDTLKETVQ